MSTRGSPVAFCGEPHECVRDLNRMGRGGIKTPQSVRKRSEVPGGICANVCQTRLKGDAAAILHDGLEERQAGLRIVFQRNRVAGHAAIGAEASPDLFSSRPGCLAGGSLAPRNSIVLLD